MLNIFSTLTQLQWGRKRRKTYLFTTLLYLHQSHAFGLLNLLLPHPSQKSQLPAPGQLPCCCNPRGQVEKSILLISVSLRTALKLLGKLQRTQKGFLLYLRVDSTLHFLEGHTFLFH